jgi:hypothetical protein
MPRTVDSVYPLTRRTIPVCNRLAVARTDFRCAALKPYRLKKYRRKLAKRGTVLLLLFPTTTARSGVSSPA